MAVVDIARGCPSTAWNVGNLGIHHWLYGLVTLGGTYASPTM